MFAMVVEVNGSSDGNYSDVRYITGYTDRSDFSVGARGQAHFPDDMRLYFNSITRISLNQVSSRGGRSIRPTIRDNNLVLRKDSIIPDRTTDRVGFNSKPSLLRPTDVLKRAGSNTYLSNMLGEFSDGVARNTVGKFNLNTSLSKRKNNNSAEHMSTTLKSYMYARAHGEDDATNSGFRSMHENESDPDYMTSAASTAAAAEDTMGNDILFDELRRFSNIIEDGYIEWGELKRMAPDFDENRDLPFTPWSSRVKAANRNRNTLDDQRYSRGIADYSSSESFYDDTQESIAALMISQAIPEILINAMYSSVQGLVLNTHPQRGEPSVHLSMAMPFMDGIPVKYGYNYLQGQFANVVLPNVSKNGLFHIEAFINAHVDNDIEIWLSIDGGPEEYFVYPVWGESIISPVVTDDERDLESISKGIAGLMEDFAIKVEGRNTRNIEIADTKEIFSRERSPASLEIDPPRRTSPGRERDSRLSLGSKIKIDI